MLFTWLFRLLIPYFEDLVVNPLTNKASLKSLAATVGFVVGIGLAVVAVWADVREGRPVEKSAIFLLLGSGLGLSSLKVLQGQLNRATATDAGMPLTKPGSDPAELMPQELNPNINGAAPATATTTTQTTLTTDPQ